MSSAPAIGRMRQNAISVATISTHNKTMSANARAPRCQPKKSQLHKAFTASCTKNRVSAARAARTPPTRQTSHAAMPQRPHKTVQTGPKKTGGGSQPEQQTEERGEGQ